MTAFLLVSLVCYLGVVTVAAPPPVGSVPTVEPPGGSVPTVEPPVGSVGPYIIQEECKEAFIQFFKCIQNGTNPLACISTASLLRIECVKSEPQLLANSTPLAGNLHGAFEIPQCIFLITDLKKCVGDAVKAVNFELLAECLVTKIPKILKCLPHF